MAHANIADIEDMYIMRGATCHSCGSWKPRAYKKSSHGNIYCGECLFGQEEYHNWQRRQKMAGGTAHAQTVRSNILEEFS